MPSLRDQRPLSARAEDRLLADTLGACRGSFVALAAFSLCVNLLTLAVPLYMLQLFDRVVPNRSTETLVVLTAIVVAALVTVAALEAVRGFILVRIGAYLERRVSGAVLSASIVRALRRRAGGRSVGALGDLASVRSFVAGPNLFPILDAPWTPIFIAVIFLLHPLVGWITVAGAAALLALAAANEFLTRPLLDGAGEAWSAAHDDAAALVRNADVIEAMGMRAATVRRWRRRHAGVLRLHGRAGVRGGAIGAAARFLRQGLQVAVLGTAAWLVLRGEMSPGAMIAGVLLMRRAVAPVDRAIGSWRSVIDARGAYARVKRRLRYARAAGPRRVWPAPTGRVHVEGLTYTPPGRSEPVLGGIEFGLEPGQVLGVIGPTAAGKSTLARLLVGILAPDSGRVRLDGVDIADRHPEDLGPYVGYLPQDVELFAGTVADNIARMAEDADLDSVVAAAKAANVHEMVLGLPHGYETEIGEDGAILSGGQRQGVGLARAVYGDPRLLVLDEPDANLDRDGTEALADALGKLKRRGATIVLITHRPAILRHADAILMLPKARLEPVVPRDGSGFHAPAAALTDGGTRRPPEPDRPRPAGPGAQVRTLTGPGHGS